eukprot:6206280-Pleurochrysis_carterae.AAC.1
MASKCARWDPLDALQALTPLLAGLGVAGAAYAVKGALHIGQRIKANPEIAKNMNAAAAGARAVGQRFKLSAITEQFAFVRGPHAVGFDATMNRREAAQILGIRRARHDGRLPTRY